MLPRDAYACAGPRLNVTLPAPTRSGRRLEQLVHANRAVKYSPVLAGCCEPLRLISWFRSFLEMIGRGRRSVQPYLLSRTH